MRVQRTYKMRQCHEERMKEQHGPEWNIDADDPSADENQCPGYSTKIHEFRCGVGREVD